jgi:hypothetical protein
MGLGYRAGSALIDTSITFLASTPESVSRPTMQVSKERPRFCV